MAVLTASQLVKRHGSHAAVNQIDLSIDEGEIVSILGPSGCGKTTLLRCVAGLEAVDGGEITINGNVVSSPKAFTPPEQRNIGMVFQSYALWPHLTVFANVAMGLTVRRRPKREIAQRVEQTLATLELSDLAARYPSQLSGGQQQRVAVARAIVVEPEILLFDEPLSNLDARIRERVRGELHDLLRKLKITTLYVTHDKAEAMAISDRIVVMRNGVIEQIGTSHEIYDAPETTFVADFIGRFNFLPAGPVDGAVAAHRITVQGKQMALAPNGGKAPGLLGFKPEDAIIMPPGAAGENSFDIKVIKETYFGSLVEIVGELLGTQITLTLPQTIAGRSLRIQLPSSKLSYFDGDGRSVMEASPAWSLKVAAE